MRRLAILLALTLAIPAFAAEDTIRKGFNVADGGTLQLTAGLGNVTIVTGGDGVAIEIVRTAHGRSAEERMREHQIDIRQSGNDVIIDGRLERDWFEWSVWNEYKVQWNIRVPDRYNVNVRTSGGSVKLDDLDGKADIATSGGSITTGRIAQEANLRSSGGSIRVAGGGSMVNAVTSGGSISIGDTGGDVVAKTSGGGITLSRVNGKVSARTSGGSIEIEDATGAVDAHTSGGSIRARLSRQPQEDSELATSGGGVTVSIAGGIGVDVDARASGGGVSSDLPITVQGTQERDELRGRIGNGGPRLYLRSSGGGIRLKSL
ncbi:MAG TPA: hypothetical protein VHK90_18040 [Thermoanaerobaculia bacterium]|nr:hypothetical protein [Thermoanaerobaculia bacterium]